MSLGKNISLENPKVLRSGCLLDTYQTGWEHFSQDCHRVGDIDDAIVLDNLGDKGSVDQIVTDRHTDSQNHAVGILLEHGFHVSLGLAVKGSIKVGRILLGKANTRSQRMLVVVDKDTTSGIDSAMDVANATKIGQVQCTNDIGADGFRLVRFTPINIGTTGNTSGIQDVGRLDFVQFGGDGLAIFQSRIGSEHLNALCN